MNTVLTAQVTQTELLPILPKADQGKFQKAENIINKGKTIEEDAGKLKNTGSSDKESAKNLKKFNLKRLEAAQFYQKGYYDKNSLLKDNIAAYWKANKNNTGNASIKNQEDRANELFRKAKYAEKSCR
ncbi:MAG: hypothetical protein HC830_04105 [Bacteroidetes bacterium]|nr:hypothetical protein [Bacteroidota bacterium]